MNQNGIWRVTAKMTGDDGVAIQNVWYVRKNTIGFTSDSLSQDDIFGAIDGLYEGLSDIMSNLVLPVSVGFYDVTNDTPLPEREWDTFVGGDGGGSAVPSGVALLATFRTAAKRVIGRKYLPQCPAAAILNGNFTTAQVAAAVAALGLVPDPFIGPSTLDEFQWVVVDKTGASHDIEEVVVRTEPAYQRRRRLGVGI